MHVGLLEALADDGLAAGLDDVRIDGWDICGRGFSVVVGATPRTGELQRGETIPWHVIAAQIAPRKRRGSR